MPATEFIDKITSRIGQIDRKSLESCVVDLSRQMKFLTTLMDHMPEGIMVLNLRKEILFLNRRFIQLFNVPENSDRKTFDRAVSDSPFIKLISESITNKQELYHKELEVLLPRPMILQINLTHDKKLGFFILSVVNVTQTEMNIRERFKLENWESMIGLAAGIAHEIGNPLNSLTIHLKLLAKSLLKLPLEQRKKVEDSIHAMEDETERLDQIVRNFLKATRRKPLQFEQTQINELIQKTISFLKPELKAAKIRLIDELDKNMPAFLLDPERIHQVFLNVIKNAVHAMPKGGTLRIQTQVKEKLCLVHFQDTGIGIPEDKIHKIFDAYYTTKEEGSGLGLMIVSQIIREHGGRIEVSSKPNTGTVFSIILPIRTEKLGLPEPEKE